MDEAWLLPYADLLTLLLALFIVLFASAQVDQKKFEMLRESFSNAFGSGSISVLDNTRTPPNVTEGIKQNTPSITDEIEPDKRETAQLESLQKALDTYIAEKKLTGALETALVNEGLVIRIKDTALFSSGSAELLPQSQVLAGEIGKLLAEMQQNIVISGHTDNVPINTAEFPTNWHLSSKRALNFMICILSKDPRLRPDRFSAIGYGEYRPLTGNQNGAEQAKNRRVEVLVVRKYQ